LASVLPVWILLQPRDYLSSWFLYFAIIIATIGILFGGHALDVNLPVYKGGMQAVTTTYGPCCSSPLLAEP